MKPASIHPAARSLMRSGLLGALIALLFLAGMNCALPGQRSAIVRDDDLGAVLERCAQAAEGMHFDVKAIDRSHQILVAEGRVEGGLAFHEIRLSIKVIHLEGNNYRVEAIATSDERGIREGAQRKAREYFFRELRETGIIIISE
ncbi:MAG: hypothetical protein Q8R92_16700 [Deltaproteobacteria bacterium]|nr:hypothetical protein [Deltaproteobacteria bacterium]